MTLEQVRIKHFRSIKETTLENCGFFNVLIGKNNCGKSTLLGAISAFFQCIGEGQIIALTPPFGDAIDFHEKNAQLPIEIEIRFSMSPDERDELTRNISSEAPQLRNAVEVLHPSLLLSATVSITNQPVRFGYLNRLALVDRRDAQPATVIFAAELPSTIELQLKFRNLRRAKTDSEKLMEAARRVDEDDFRRIRDSEGRYPRSYFFRATGEATAAVAQTFESLLQESANHKEFRRLVNESAEKLVAEANSSYSEPLKSPIATFSGEGAEIPKYVHYLTQALASVRVLYLNEHRKPLGKDEAQQLLQLKVRRGGNEALRSIQETVQALLGVRVDAFESATSTVRGNAEMDVDDFLLEVNGSGIREALRLVLDYEFKHPSILLVEEPEVHLHPALEIAMKRYLKQIGERCQVFLSTHSTNFLDGGDMTNIYLVSKAHETAVQLLNLQDAQARIPKELGLRLSSLFMFDRLVFVEGPSDEAVFREIANKLGVNLAQQNVGFITMGGVRNFTHYATEAILSFLTKRQVAIWFILDGDESEPGDIARLKERLSDRASVHFLCKRELENYMLVSRAVSAFLELKLRSSQAKDSDYSPERISALFDDAAERLKSLSLFKRVSKQLCKPLFCNCDFQPTTDEGQIETRISNLFAQHVSELTSRQERLSGMLSAKAAELELEWHKSKLDIVPGPELLDLVCQNFGVRFKKEADSPRLASLLTAEEIDPELRSLVKLFGR